MKFTEIHHMFTDMIIIYVLSRSYDLKTSIQKNKLCGLSTLLILGQIDKKADRAVLLFVWFTERQRRWRVPLPGTSAWTLQIPVSRECFLTSSYILYSLFFKSCDLLLICIYVIFLMKILYRSKRQHLNKFYNLSIIGALYSTSAYHLQFADMHIGQNVHSTATICSL